VKQQHYKAMWKSFEAKIWASLTSIALRDSMLKTRASPRRFRLRIRRNSCWVMTYGTSVVVTFSGSSLLDAGAV
jgi:hypothetical protein